MQAEILDGSKMSQDILAELKDQVEAMKARHGRAPGLATILIGDNPASVSYVTRKVKTALKLGFHEVQQTLPASTRQQDLLSLVEQYNQDPHIDGILVQLPLPDSICEQAVVHAIDPSKDVDGFHPVNLGRMMQGERDTCYLPCTPAGIQEMLVRSGTQTRGAEVVVVGRSAIVGRPVATLLGQKGTGANSTVTLVHTATRDLASHCQRADILVVAAGVPGLVQPDWIKPGATVIDVGVNRIGVCEQTGKARLCGDVDFEAGRLRAGKITPVPGGVGPMTIAMLMKNTVQAALRHLEA